VAIRLRDQTTVAKPDLGSKRQCQTCGAKFFDLHKSPILCPKCGVEFVTVALARAPARAAAVAEDEDVAVDPAIELVPIEDAEEGGEKVPVVADDDVEIEDDAGDDDTFLAEEEEDDDDVADLIDGEIEDDEEA
jgi:uncharacterized protein (TIGR02300 family)